VFAALASTAVLGIAFGSEIWAELVPCALCLVERWPYRIVIVLGLIAAIAPKRAAKPLLLAIALCLLADVAIGAVHVGVENKWWPSPLPECAAPKLHGGSAADWLKSMPAAPSKSCEDPTYLIAFLPLSMAAMNMLFSLGLSLLCLDGMRRKPR
jgi:disulfide bond formation protein DsbB